MDVSIYEPVSWLEEEAEECATVFVKDCQEKTEEVCMDVSESRCQVGKKDTGHMCQDKEDMTGDTGHRS